MVRYPFDSTTTTFLPLRKGEVPLPERRQTYTHPSSVEMWTLVCALPLNVLVAATSEITANRFPAGRIARGVGPNIWGSKNVASRQGSSYSGYEKSPLPCVTWFLVSSFRNGCCIAFVAASRS